MNVILAIEALNPPLAGVGRYAWELATRLPHQVDVESVRYMSDGLWRALPMLNQGENQSINLKARIRQGLGRSTRWLKYTDESRPTLREEVYGN